MVDGLLDKKIVFIIQARMASTRLPGKILMPLPIGSDKSILFHIVKNLKNVSVQNEIYIATSLDSANDPLVDFCKVNKINCYRGSEDNVLSRFTDIIEKNNEYDYVVRLTGDNPIVDKDLLQEAFIDHCLTKADYTISQGLPTGMNFEIITAQVLSSLVNEELTTEDKEHVTLFLKKSKNYKISVVDFTENVGLKELRLTIDYPSDYLVLSAIFSIADNNNLPINLGLIKYCQEKYEWLFEVNKTNYQKRVFESLNEEIEEVKPLLKEYEFNRLFSFLENINDTNK